MLNRETNQLVDLSDMSTDDLVSNSWQNTWEKGQGNRAYLLANQGVKVTTLYCSSIKLTVYCSSIKLALTIVVTSILATL